MTRSGGTAVGLVARREWRARWRSYVVIAGLVAVTVGMAVATASAASRSLSAFERLREETNASDVVVSYDGTTLASATAGLDHLAGLLDVERAVELSLRPAGTEYFPNFQLLAVAPGEGEGAIDRPVILRGSAVDPAQGDEVAVDESLAAELDVEPGDVITLETMTADWVDAASNGGDPGPPDGPRVRVTVTGIARSPADFSRLQAVIFLSPAFVERYGDDVATHSVLRARVEPKTLASAAESDVLASDLEVQLSAFGDQNDTADGLGTISAALQVVGLAATLAGLVAAGLAALRVSRAAAASSETMRAIGWTRRERVRSIVVTLTPSLVTGVLAGVVVGIFATPLFMRGLARAVDPHPDARRPNVVVVMGSGGALLVVGLAGAWLVGRAATRRRAKSARTSRASLPLQRPVSMVIGVRNALRGSATPGGWASPVALAVGLLSVTSIVGALLISASIQRVEDDPSLSGKPAVRVIDSGETIDGYDTAMRRLEDDDRLAVLAGAHLLYDIAVDGHGGANTLAIDAIRGHVDLSLIRGRFPNASDEVALGPATLDAIGKDVGDRVTLHGPRHDIDAEVVGSMLFPEGDFFHDEGTAVTVAAGARLVGDVRGDGIHQVFYEWKAGVDARSADAELIADGLDVLANSTTLKPASVENLGEVVGFPRFLALFVALLALVTLAHATWVATRSRAGELVTMRALGMTARSTAGVVATQVVVVALLALALGIPLGLAFGRKLWATIAESAHVVVRVVLPAGDVGRVIAATAGAVALLVAAATWRVVRLRPAALLRRE